MEYFVLPEAFKEICSGFIPTWAAKILADKEIISRDGRRENSAEQAPSRHGANPMLPFHSGGYGTPTRNTWNTWKKQGVPETVLQKKRN